ncbi:hypothetical protein VTK56DRAFT_736 [Thermocarpiscus australiensis]
MADRGQNTGRFGQNMRARMMSAAAVASRAPSRTPAPSQEIEHTDRWLTDRIVTIAVGPEEKRWAVHEKLLSDQSEFFDEFFNGSEDTAGQDEMKLPDEDPKLFALFIRWLYGTAFATSGGNRVFRFTQPDGKDVTVRDYLALYVLGGKFGILGVRNAVIDVLYVYFGEASDDHKAPNLLDVKYIFDHTLPDAPIRRFLIAHTLFYLFSKNRRNAPLPGEWAGVLTENGEIGCAMIRMLADWNWVIGANAPAMKIKPRTEFHERLPQPPVIKREFEESHIDLLGEEL